MAGLRRTLTLLALGSAIASRAAGAQHGSSTSLTHTVSGTVQGGRFTFTCAGPQPGLPAPTYHLTRG